MSTLIFCFFVFVFSIWQNAKKAISEMKKPKILLDLSSKNIFHLKASSNYTILNLVGGKRLISSYNLKVFETLFARNSFVRIDRSNLVNRAFISGITEREDGVYIHLKNNTEILIPRRRKAVLINQYPNLSNSHYKS
ncbi:MAG: DNA-binding LytR/AlgR family response regulator [Spirosomataceae bacterium]